jgi:hypothetical protein
MEGVCTDIFAIKHAGIYLNNKVSAWYTAFCTSSTLPTFSIQVPISNIYAKGRCVVYLRLC